MIHDPHVSLWACHVASPFFMFFPKFGKYINSSYDVGLRKFTRRWKFLAEIYAMISFSLEFEKINFLAFQILLDHTFPLKKFWTYKSMHYSKMK
jgi:hypothetical protein